MSENYIGDPLIFKLSKLFPVIKHDALRFISGSYDPEVILVAFSIELDDKEDAEHSLLPRLTYGS